MIGRIALDGKWKEAIEQLARHRLRTALTLLGLIFGVGAIVAMQGVGEGSRREALRLVESLGLRNLIVEHKRQETEALKEVRTRSLGLSLDDARAALDTVPGAQRYAAEKSIRALGVFSDEGRSDAVASAISPDYFPLASLHVSDGRTLSKGDSESLAAVAVLGHQAARDLFPHGSAIGKIFKLNHVWLTVVGVLADRDLTQNQFEGVSLGLDSNRIFVPLGTGLARFRFEPMDDEVDRVLLELRDADQLNDATKVLASVLDQRHAGAGDYSVIVPQQLYEQHQKTQRIFSIVMGAIAGISLLVGGIGIMNIMLANVMERRREIGLLRAVGARQRDIVQQFLREATVICTTGALIGLLFGALLAYAIAAFAGWQVAWAPITILLSTSACVLIGLAFSVYPARQAAALDPITAIRSE